MLWSSNSIGIRLRSHRQHLFLVKKFTSAYTSLGKLQYDRMQDKIHRSYYRSLERERIKYKRHITKIEPSIKNLLYLLQKESERDTDSILISKSPSSFESTFKSMLEPVTFHCILALHYLNNRGSISEKYIHEQSNIQRNYLISILQKIRHNKNKSIDEIKSKLEKDNNINISFECSKILELYSLNSVSETEREILELSLLVFVSLSKEYYYNKFNIKDDLMKWISSINESNISGACAKLTNLTEIPPFVLYDILIRTPMSSSEYFLQVDIWLDYMKDIAVYYFKKTSSIKLCFDNLLFYGAHYSDDVSNILNSTLSFFTDTKSGYRFKFINTDYLNQIIWNLAYDRIRSSSSMTKIDNNLLKAQEIVVKCVHSFETADDLTNRLDLKAHMGIVLAIESISTKKANQLFNVAEKRFIFGNHVINNKELISYNATKILLSAMPEQLLNNFNTAATNYSHSAIIWLTFIKKLSSFGLLNEQRSIKILKELVANSDTLIITKDIILLLLFPIKTISGMNSFISILKTLKYNLAESHLSSILPKYLSLLYKNKKSKIKRVFPWETIPKHVIKFDSTLEYARYIYKNSFKKLTSNIIGIMLNGEVNVQPDQIFELYKTELDKSNLIPDASCLAALFRAALKTRNNYSIIWDNMYAPQIAIHEFKKYSISGPSLDLNRETHIFPTDDLWQLYIQLLSKFNYVSELSTIIKWWEEINFTPSRDTLWMLLKSLPYEFSSRYIQHVEKVNKDSIKLISDSEISTTASTKSSIQWPWPSSDEWEFQNANCK